MLQLLPYLFFVISVACAAGGIMLASRLRSRYRSEAFSSLLFFQAFVFTFGFYSLWGQIFIRSFLVPAISTDLPETITGFSVIMGLPFLVFAWMMLLQFSMLITGREKSNWFILIFLLANFGIIIAAYLITRNFKSEIISRIKYYYIVMNSIYMFIAAVIIARPVRGKALIHDRDSRIVSPAIIIITVLQSLPLAFYKSNLWPLHFFIFLFFSGYAFFPVWFHYGTMLQGQIKESSSDLSFEGFCKRYEISPRESEIINEICNGLSNKEISDKLFISLQTVKDHTHRIYIKTNVRNRVQLINLVRELSES